MCGLPMRAGLESPDAVVRPAARSIPDGALQALTGQLVNVVDDQPVPDVIDRVAAIQTRIGVGGRIAFAGRRTVSSGGAAVPSRAVIDRVTVSVVHIEEQPVADIWRLTEAWSEL